MVSKQQRPMARVACPTAGLRACSRPRRHQSPRPPLLHSNRRPSTCTASRSSSNKLVCMVRPSTASSRPRHHLSTLLLPPPCLQARPPTRCRRWPTTTASGCSSPAPPRNSTRHHHPHRHPTPRHSRAQTPCCCCPLSVSEDVRCVARCRRSMCCVCL